MGLDRNATVWQRLEHAIDAAVEDSDLNIDRDERLMLVADLHGYVIAERTDAVAQAARRREAVGR